MIGSSTRKIFLITLSLFILVSLGFTQVSKIGVVNSQLGNVNDALIYFKQAKKLKKQLKDLVGQKLCEKNLEILQEKIKGKKTNS